MICHRCFPQFADKRYRFATAEAFCPRKRQACITDELHRFQCVKRRRRYAAAGRQAHLLSGDDDRFGNTAHDGAGRLVRLCGVGVFQQHRELISADARNDSVLPCGHRQTLGYFAKDAVANRVA
ncbi:hypothetical protein D3C81_1882760 [compost metagenome]